MKEVIGNFRILAKVGEGGMGNVFRGRDLMLERDVAIKSLRPELACYEEVVERFRTEAIALARLQHHNIANVFSFFAEDGQYYMVMEFVDGEPLNRLARRCGAMPWADAVGLVVQALQGLEHAHHAGVVHRDIKPSNMIVTADGTLKLMDFGIARILEKVGLTRTGCVVGTLHYVSPEQARGADIDARSDLYSTAVVLYELVTGRVPFDSGSEFELMRAHIEQPPPPPSALVAGLPAALEAVILGALAKDPAERYQSAEAFRADLEHLLLAAGGTESGRTVIIDLPELPVSPLPRRTATRVAPAPAAAAAPAPRSRLPLVLAVGVLVAIGLGVGAWMGLRPPPATPEVPVASPPAPALPSVPAVAAPLADPLPAQPLQAPAAALPPVEPEPPVPAAAAVAAPPVPAPAPAMTPPAERKPVPREDSSARAPARTEPARPQSVERPPRTAAPSVAAAPAQRSTPQQRDGRCARLVQQLSLGERLPEADIAFLRANCGD